MTVAEAVHRAGQKVQGPWGPHTSTIDWCEDNYAHYPYIAETYNTLSNIPFILLGLHGAANTPGGHLSHVLAYLGVSAIGIGSFIFHATLLWEAQVYLDELPMIYVSSIVLYIVAAAGPGAQSRSTAQSLALKFGIAAVPILITAIYLRYPNPVIHQTLYALIQVSCHIRIRYLSKYLKPEQVQPGMRLMITGTLVFLLGFAIWNVDNIWCTELTNWRGTVPEALGWVSQGHAWWHLLTGIGACRIITGVTHLTLSIENPAGYDIAYRLGVIPYLVPRPIGTSKSS